MKRCNLFVMLKDEQERAGLINEIKSTALQNKNNKNKIGGNHEF